MNSPQTDNERKAASPASTPFKKRRNPFFIAGAVLLALVLGGWLLNRGKNPPPNMGAGESAHAEHGDEGHAEHGEEEGHEEHGEEEGGHDMEGEVIKFEGEAAKTSGIVVTPISLAPLATGIPFNGQIAPNPNGSVRVSSIVPGRITRLLVSQGDTVRQGQTLAIVESRAIGEAQSQYQQAISRFQSAQSNLNVVLQQARAGVFSRAPVEVARRAVVDAAGDVRAQETATRQGRTALDIILRQARAGTFASPAVEAARAQKAAAEESLKTTAAALTNARSSVESASAELQRRRELASAGAYVSRPVEEARRFLVASQSARSAAQSEIATTRANLARARSLTSEGLVSRRDFEASQQAFETAEARLETARADENQAQTELERQQKLASTNVAGAAEVQQAQSAVASASADVRTRLAEVTRAREGARLADIVLRRERNVFGQNIANRREVSVARGNLQVAQNALTKARQTLALANTAYGREARIFKANLNNTAQVQAARSGYVQAQSDVRAARRTLALFKSSPGRSASVPIVAPITGTVQERDVAQGEVLESDTHLMTLVNLSEVAVEVALPERDVSRVRYGSEVSISVDAVPDRRFAGRITFIGTQLNVQTRTLTARALVPSAGVLRPGMFARGQIQTGSGQLSLSVPSDAVQTVEDKTVVYVQGKPNEFNAREVVTGETNGGRTLIKSGLKTGERVVTKGAFMVKAQAMKAELGHSH